MYYVLVVFLAMLAVKGKVMWFEPTKKHECKASLRPSYLRYKEKRTVFNFLLERTLPMIRPSPTPLCPTH